MHLLSHLPPVPTLPLIGILLALAVVRFIVAVAVRRVKREMRRQLRQALVTGLAVGAGVGFVGGKRRGAAIVRRVP